MSCRHKLTIFSRRRKLKKVAVDRGIQTMITATDTTPALATSVLAAATFSLDSNYDPPSFPSFPYLPTEIRLKIWHSALPTRILPVQAHHSFISSSATSFLCTEPPPVLLSVSRESRMETLRFYIVVSDKFKKCPPHSRFYKDPIRFPGPGHRFYFNPHNDTIFLDTTRAAEWLRILRVIESHSRILSLALRNAHRCPNTFAIEVVAEKGVREMFVVGNFEEFGWTPEVWALLPRRRGGGVISGEWYCGGVVECIEAWECGEERMPSVTAVKEDFWMREGLEVVGRW